MLVFIISVIIGAGQILLTEQLIYAFGKRDFKKILLFFGSKFLLYGISIGVLVIKFVWHIGMAFCGFVVGVPIAVVVLFVYKTIYKKRTFK